MVTATTSSPSTDTKDLPSSISRTSQSTISPGETAISQSRPSSQDPRNIHISAVPAESLPVDMIPPIPAESAVMMSSVPLPSNLAVGPDGTSIVGHNEHGDLITVSVPILPEGMMNNVDLNGQMPPDLAHTAQLANMSQMPLGAGMMQIAALPLGQFDVFGFFVVSVTR